MAVLNGSEAMSEAIYGLLGALGGALITAAAAYWGPWRVAQAARQDARDVEARTRREAEITRIILLRTTTRAWLRHVQDGIASLVLGMPVDHAAFHEATTAARNAAQSAFDDSLHDGMWLKQSDYGDPFPGSSQGKVLVLSELNRLTELTRSEMIRHAGFGANPVPLEPELRETLQRALDDVVAARAELTAMLLNRLEMIMSVSIIGGTTSALQGRRTTAMRAIDE